MPPADRRRARLRVAFALVLAALSAAVAGCSSPVRPGAVPAASSSSSPSSSSASSPGGSSSAATSLPPLPAKPGPIAAPTTAAPVRLQIPSIGVDTGLENLGLLADGSMASPSTWPEAGWYTRGVRPGDPGPAIVAGHVDSYLGPAVFYELGKLKPGDVAVITRADHTVVRFVVESKAQYPKSHFPTSDVYGPTPTPELRLITCTGIFDRSVRSYEDNLVVTAVLAG